MTTTAQQLTRALRTLSARGERPPCGDPATRNLWVADSAEERAVAAGLCEGCPVIASWAGVDRTWHAPSTIATRRAAQVRRERRRLSKSLPSSSQRRE